jgi:hypothetical protein
VMSGRIRRTLGPRLKHLRKYVAEGRQILDAQEKTDEGVNRLRFLMIKVKQSMEMLDSDLEKWDTIINNLPPGERGPEEQLYENYGQENRHIWAWIDDGREAIMDIEILLAEFESDNGTVTHFSGSDHGIRDKATENEHVGVRDPTIGEDRRTSRKSGLSGELSSYLPLARLPEFFGEIEKWPEFWQAFERTVDCLQIYDGLKAYYLIQSIRGKAQRSIAGYRAISEHYEPLKDALLRQFGNMQVIKDSLYAELLTLAPANESAASLRSFLEDVERICRSLIAINALDDKGIIIMAIKNKLPYEVVLELLTMEKFGKKIWDLDDLRAGLADIVSLREEANRCFLTFSRLNHPRHDEHGPRPSHHHKQDENWRKEKVNNRNVQPCDLLGSVFAIGCSSAENGKIGKQQQYQRWKFGCMYSGENNHISGKCQNVSDVSARKNVGNGKKNSNFDEIEVRKEGQNKVMSITNKEENQMILMSAEVKSSEIKAPDTPFGKGLAFSEDRATVNFISEEKMETSVETIICGEICLLDELIDRPSDLTAVKGVEPLDDDLMENFRNLETTEVQDLEGRDDVAAMQILEEMQIIVPVSDISESVSTKLIEENDIKQHVGKQIEHKLDGKENCIVLIDEPHENLAELKVESFDWSFDVEHKLEAFLGKKEYYEGIVVIICEISEKMNSDLINERRWKEIIDWEFPPWPPPEGAVADEYAWEFELETYWKVFGRFVPELLLLLFLFALKLLWATHQAAGNPLATMRQPAANVTTQMPTSSQQPRWTPDHSNGRLSGPMYMKSLHAVLLSQSTEQ